MRVLIADDEQTIAITLSDTLKGAGHDVDVANDGERAWRMIQQTEFDCVLLDIKLPEINGMELLKRIKESRPQLPVIMITGFGTVETAVEAMKRGAFDYVQKPFYNEEIVLILERLTQYNTLSRDYQRLKELIKSEARYSNLIGNSRQMLDVYQLIETVAQNDCSVLIEGDSGTGKELIADAIHFKSPRKDYPLVKISCAVIPETLLEAELFGHEKGAFTDAKNQKIGRFEVADKGTIFIDDIDDMSPRAQMKLLRVLQEHTLERLGGTRVLQVDIRVVAATKVDLSRLVKEGLFREDLFYRLNVVTIKVPPLRARTSDIPLLTQHFINKYGKDKEYIIEPETLIAMQNYNWPGNVRELENSVERAIALSGENHILKKDHLLKPLIDPALSQEPQLDEIRPLDEFLHRSEEDYIKRIMGLYKGNKIEVARVLKLSRKTLWEKLHKYGLD
jgi:DNA-binding NtrC family response regulator